MANLYIFAIGGSGSRVLRSLTMILASGVEVKHNIVPMILDPDIQNGDLQRTVQEMRLYKSIHDELTYSDETKSKFFSANIDSLNNDGNYLLSLNGTSGIDFDKYIRLATMSVENQAMMRMLYSNSNLSSKMDVGFKGNPNIGSIVLNQFVQSAEYNKFENNFVNGDKVFVVSSIFGGTGASGFPLLLKTMRTSRNNALKSAYIGAVSLLPYFNLDNNQNSAIKADSFVTKAKAALNYYERNVTGNGSLDEMYYLGDELSSQPYVNNDGGVSQLNDAHIIELLAALAIVDFDRKTWQSDGIRQTGFHEFGLNSATPAGDIVFTDFGDATKNVLLKPLSQMAIMNSYLNNRSESHRLSQRWAKEHNEMLGASFFRGAFFQKYLLFKKNDSLGFESWILQMEKNQKAFRPFADDNDLKSRDGLSKVAGFEPHYSGFALFKKKGYDLIDERLSANITKLEKKGLNAPTAFMELFYLTLEEILDKNLDIR